MYNRPNSPAGIDFGAVSGLLLTPVESSKDPGKAPRRILHINHPAAFLRLVEKYCVAEKIAVDSFESGPVGFHHALARRYHMIILGFPLSGVDAFRILKGLVRAKVPTPVLIMADNRARLREDFGRFPNVIGCIGKPFDAKELSRFLDSVRKPVELDPQEKLALLAMLRKWETVSKNAH